MVLYDFVFLGGDCVNLPTIFYVSELAILKDEYFPESEPENECDDIYSPSNCKACDIKSP